LEGNLAEGKSQVDRLGVPTGVTGETNRGVLIADLNRVSGFVTGTDIPGVKDLLARRHEKYRRVNVPAVVFGLHQPDGSVNYAIYANYTPEG
jgi:hypothetical protein